MSSRDEVKKTKRIREYENLNPGIGGVRSGNGIREWKLAVALKPLVFQDYDFPWALDPGMDGITFGNEFLDAKTRPWTTGTKKKQRPITTGNDTTFV